MNPLQQEKQRKIAAVLLIVYATLLFAMAMIETIMMSAERMDLVTDFQRHASLNYSGSVFLVYLFIGGAGFVGTLGLMRTFGHSDSLITDGTKLCGFAHYLCAYWLYYAVDIVLHKITLLTDRPTSPSEALLQIYGAAGHLRTFAFWGSLGPSILFFVGLFLMLWRGARRLPRIAAGMFLFLAASRVLNVFYIILSGSGASSTSPYDFAYVNDLMFAIIEILAFLVAGAALFTEKGLFQRTRWS
jgi:hypothetical protein